VDLLEVGFGFLGGGNLLTGWNFVDDIPKDAKMTERFKFSGPVCALAGLLERFLNIKLSKTLQSHPFYWDLDASSG